MVILPALLVAASVALAGVLVWIEATLHTSSLVNMGKLVPFLTAFTAVNVAQNVITTCEAPCFS